MEKSSHRAVIQYLQKKGLRPKEIHEDMVATLGEDAPAYATVKKWAAIFKHGRESLEDGPRSGRPPSATTSNFVDQVHNLVMANRRVTIRHIASVVGISTERIRHILTTILALRKVSACWVPRDLGYQEVELQSATAVVPVQSGNEELLEVKVEPDVIYGMLVAKEESSEDHNGNVGMLNYAPTSLPNDEESAPGTSSSFNTSSKS